MAARLMICDVAQQYLTIPGVRILPNIGCAVILGVAFREHRRDAIAKREVEPGHMRGPSKHIPDSFVMVD